MSNHRSLALLAAPAVLAIIGLAGCTSTGDGSVTHTSGPAKQAAASTPIPTIPMGRGIIASTTMTSCDTTGTQVTAKGTVTMPKGGTGNAVISVSWVNSKNSSVYGRGVATLSKVSAGDKKEWSTTATLPADAQSVSCVLGAVMPK